MTLFRCTHVLDAVADGLVDVEPAGPRIFGRDVDVVPGEPAFAQRDSDFGLVAIALGRVCGFSHEGFQARRGLGENKSEEQSVFLGLYVPMCGRPTAMAWSTMSIVD